MPTVTMIQEEQAAVGHEFVFLGATTQRQECKVKGVCLNQSAGRRYKIVRLRDVTHGCLLSGDVVRVIEVEASAPPTSLDARAAREDSVVVYQPKTCADLACEHNYLCNPSGLQGGMRVQVAEVEEKLACFRGLNLVAVKVTYSSE